LHLDRGVPKKSKKSVEYKVCWHDDPNGQENEAENLLHYEVYANAGSCHTAMRQGHIDIHQVSRQPSDYTTNWLLIPECVQRSLEQGRERSPENIP
jgi:hypothetical protein